MGASAYAIGLLIPDFLILLFAVWEVGRWRVRRKESACSLMMTLSVVSHTGRHEARLTAVKPLKVWTRSTVERLKTAF